MFDLLCRFILWILTKEALYAYKLAGLRARSLVGLDTNIYKGPAIIAYSIADSTLDSVSCDQFCFHFPVADQPRPGYLIIGKDKKHCGLLDNEGTKFVHDDVNTKKVVHVPLSSARSVFPEGFEYRSYPNRAGILNNENTTE